MLKKLGVLNFTEEDGGPGELKGLPRPHEPRDGEWVQPALLLAPSAT